MWVVVVCLVVWWFGGIVFECVVLLGWVFCLLIVLSLFKFLFVCFVMLWFGCFSLVFA